LGGLVLTGALLHFVENRYAVSLTPSETGSWTMLVPRPLVPMRLEVTGQGVLHAPTETPYGPMENVSGEGEVTLRYSLTRWELRLTRFGIGDGGRYFIGVSGQPNATTLFVWMGSDSVPQLNVTGIGSWQGFHLGSSISCGGPAFVGDVSPGWNAVPARLLDCLIGIDAVPWLEVMAPAFLVAGGAILYRASPRGSR
ncbi:MAG: hypothetical protein R3291_05900, partial [Thermoplasmata archaeon]|nr:hypothetical protein [Thermoplasmata archaeon]